MSFLNWLKPGLKIKRWILVGLIGLSLIFFGVLKLTENGISFIYICLCILGILLIYIAIKLFLKSIVSVLPNGVNGNNSKIGSLLYEQRLLNRGPRIVAIGGGTGLSTMLRGIKEYTSNITAIVTVADDGGSSGMLRESLGILPPGDIRNCILALAHTEPVLEELLQYRFKDGNLKGQSFGNLFLAAMNGISSSFEEAIKKMSDVLAVVGRVYPVTLDNVTLNAELDNGEIIKGESQIPKYCLDKKLKIKRVFLEPENVKPFKEALDAIDSADCIIIGPGSLYTSILPNLVIKEVSSRVKSSNAIKIYVSNIMTQPGETDGYKLSDHLKAIENAGVGKIDFVISNNGEIPREYYNKYKEDGQYIVEVDEENLKGKTEIFKKNLVLIKGGLLRHDTNILSKVIMKLVLKHKIPRIGKRMDDYSYLSNRLKERGR